MHACRAQRCQFPAQHHQLASTTMALTRRTATAARKRSPGVARAASLTATAALLVAACGGGSGDGGGPQEAAPAPSESTTSTAAAPASTTTAPATAAAPATTAPASTTSTTAATTTTTTTTSTTTTTTAPPPTTTTVAVPQPEASTVAGLIALERPLVIAHAAGDQDYPHSTLYAYTQSAAAGSDILELDVMLTADGALIVQHDDTVDRTTEASGPVNELTLAEIKALDNAHWFVAGFWGDQTRPAEDYVFRGVRTGAVEPPEGFGPDDFRVATFREVAERFPDHVLDVEIKLQRGPDGQEDLATGIAGAEVLAAEIADLGREDSVIVACFNDEVLELFNEFAPSVATTPGEAALLGWFTGGSALDDRISVVQVPFTYQGIPVVTADTVARVHDEGREVWVWLSGTDVVETREFYAELFALGVDGVIAGRPAEAMAALANMG
ncbi:MAG: hypothetical protein F4126_00995 [Acidimicrobiaceae bacterium]|nr:hypothetical protein [Acidimicrobiaceae bacterium]